MKMLFSWVLLKPIEEEKVSKGGIILVEKQKQAAIKAEVIKMGPEADLEVAVGDTVIVPINTGYPVDLAGVNHIIVEDFEIIAKWIVSQK